MILCQYIFYNKFIFFDSIECVKTLCNYIRYIAFYDVYVSQLSSDNKETNN